MRHTGDSRGNIHGKHRQETDKHTQEIDIISRAHGRSRPAVNKLVRKVIAKIQCWIDLREFLETSGALPVTGSSSTTSDALSAHDQ